MITSLANPQVKHIAQLMKKSRYRRECKQYIAEGERLVLEIPLQMLEKVYISESAAYQGLWQEWLEGKPYEVFSDHVFGELSQTQTPQGIMAVVKMAESDPKEMLRGSRYLLLENLQDPGNLGTIIRTAEGAGMDGVFLSRTCVDIYNPKVVRSTMGAIYRVPFAYIHRFTDLIQLLKDQGIRIYGAAVEDAKDCFEADLSGRCGVLIGNEANGLSEETLSLVDGRLKIPMAGELESLNAAMAAGILMYEMRRQQVRK